MVGQSVQESYEVSSLGEETELMGFRILVNDCRCVLWVINHSTIAFVNKRTRQLLVEANFYFRALNCCFSRMYIAKWVFQVSF